jgi:hypothetical protein
MMNSANDPRRPLSMSPEQWSMRRGSLKQAESITASDDNIILAKAGGETTGLEQVDAGVDSIIKGIEQINAGMKQLESIELSASEKATLSEVKELVDTAIAPYTADIVEKLDSLEGDE